MLESLGSRGCRIARESLPFGMGAALLIGALVFLTCISTARSAWAEDVNTVRVDNNISVLSSDPNPFLVPIFIRHSPDVDAVHIGLDYDELMLRFSNVYSLENSIGLDPWYVITDDEKGGHISLLVPFDPTQGLDEESLLIQLQFSLADPTTTTNYGYRSSTDLQIDDSSTFFLKAGDQQLVWPEASLDGNVTVYSCDALEVGSAQISPDHQSFSIPIYVTHIQPETMPFSMGLDYDEVYLELVGVTPVSPLLEAGMLHFDRKTETGQAWIEAPFVNKVFPQLLRYHLLDLVFEYRPGVGAPESKVLKISPTFSSVSRTPEGGMVGETRDGTLSIIGPKFLRGDADGSKRVDLNDAFMILSFVTGMESEGMESPSCLDAMDIDMDGQIDISDAIQVLNFLFLSGSPPAPPFPAPGSNPPDAPTMGCASGEPAFEPLPLPAGF